MANPEHLEIIKRGAGAWNRWRAGIEVIQPNLAYADLGGADLHGAQLGSAKLYGAALRGAHLIDASLAYADLRGADLAGSHLLHATLRGANLRGADLTRALVGWTDITDVDLGEVKGLETVKHLGPSSIGVDTLYRSGGKIPDSFLRGCGVPDDFITFIPSHLGARQAIQFYSCFISYSSRDQNFADRLYADLQRKGVRCWFAPEDLKTGDRFWDRIEETIRVYDKLLLILSEYSIASAWVEREVTAALEREDSKGHTVLFPIRLDEGVLNSGKAWAASLRRTRHITDFTGWKDHDSYQRAFDRLLRDLQAESQKPGV